MDRVNPPKNVKIVEYKLNWMNHPKMLEDCSTTHFKLKRINQAVMSKQRPDDELTKESNSSSKDCLGTKSDL